MIDLVKSFFPDFQVVIQNIDTHDMYQKNCPGEGCVRGFVHFLCKQFSNESISASYNATVIHPGKNDFYILGQNYPAIGEKIYSHFENAFINDSVKGLTCEEILSDVCQKFFLQLDQAAEKFNTISKPAFEMPHKIVTINYNYGNIAIAVSSVVVCSFAIYKCYRYYKAKQD